MYQIREIATDMRILGIETSGFDGEIALIEAGEVIEERSLTLQGRRHAQSLVMEVADLLKSRDLRPADIDAVGVSIGPGSFTGLRVGVVFAKTWCYAVGCRLVAVDTLQAVAENTPGNITRLHVIADAQRGDLFVGEFFRRDDGRFERTTPVAIIPAQRFAEGRCPDDFVTGPGLQRHESLISACCRTASPDQRSPRAGVVARIAARQAAANCYADFWTLEPFYLRKSAAEEKADQAG